MIDCELVMVVGSRGRKKRRRRRVFRQATKLGFDWLKSPKLEEAKGALRRGGYTTDTPRLCRIAWAGRSKGDELPCGCGVEEITPGPEAAEATERGAAGQMPQCYICLY
jgi:hypothetical protein